MGDQAVSLFSPALAQGLIMLIFSFNRILISRTLQFPFINLANQISKYLIQIPSGLVLIPTVSIRNPTVSNRIPPLQTIL
jgi:hypothetical protein